MSTPQQFLDTLFVYDARGRIVSTREPEPSRGPLLCFVRGAESTAWSVHAELPDALAEEVHTIARREAPIKDFRSAPAQIEVLRDCLGAFIKTRYGAAVAVVETSGPAMTFPDHVGDKGNVEIIEDERLLAPEFRGWAAGEIARGRAPVFAAIQDGRPVSICFCARSSPVAAEAGVETADRYRGRGLAARVAAAWACAIRAQGRVPQYSTFWTNAASLSVARKLGLIARPLKQHQQNGRPLKTTDFSRFQAHPNAAVCKVGECVTSSLIWPVTALLTVRLGLLK